MGDGTAAKTDKTAIRNEQKRRARMRQREAKTTRLTRCTVCDEALPDGSRLDRTTCSERCRQARRRKDAKDRDLHLCRFKYIPPTAVDGEVRSEKAIAEIEFDTRRAVERLAARRPDGIVSEDEMAELRRKAEAACDKRTKMEEAREEARREEREARWRAVYG